MNSSNERVHTPLRAYLHELVKTFLVYEAEKARDIICATCSEWNMFCKEHEIRAVRPEIGWRRFVDVVWLLMGRDSEGWPVAYVIGFEIKTGKYSTKWIEQFREVADNRQRLEEILVKHYLNSVERRWSIVFYHHVFVCRRMYMQDVLENAKKVYEHVHSIPLELFLPLIRERVENLLKSNMW